MPPAIRNEIHTAAPATSPAAPSREKIPAPTMAAMPMKAACQTLMGRVASARASSARDPSDARAESSVKAGILARGRDAAPAMAAAESHFAQMCANRPASSRIVDQATRRGAAIQSEALRFLANAPRLAFRRTPARSSKSTRLDRFRFRVEVRLWWRSRT
jgi:hypothetical protein